MTIQEFLAGLEKDGIKVVKVDQVQAKDCAGETAAFTDAEAAKAGADAEAEKVKAALDEQAERVKAALEDQQARIRSLLRMAEDLKRAEAEDRKNDEDGETQETESKRIYLGTVPQEITRGEIVQMVSGLIKGKLLVSMLGDRARKEGDEKFDRNMNEIFDALTMIEKKFVRPMTAAVYAHMRKGDA